MPIAYRGYSTHGLSRCSGKVAAKCSNWMMYSSRFKWTNPKISAKGSKSKWKDMTKFKQLSIDSLTNGIAVAGFHTTFDRRESDEITTTYNVYQCTIEQ